MSKADPHRPGFYCPGALMRQRRAVQSRPDGNSLSGKHQGRASAAALILFGIIFIVTMINLRVSKKKVHY